MGQYQRGNNDRRYLTKGNRSTVRKGKISQNIKHREMKSIGYTEFIKDPMLKITGSKNPSSGYMGKDLKANSLHHKSSLGSLHPQVKELFPPLNRRF